MYTIYIQKHNGEFIGDYAYAAYEGFKYRKYKIKFFELIDEVPVDINNVIVGYVETTIKYFNKLGINVPDPIHIPIDLFSLSNRVTYKTTMGEVKEYGEEKFPLFIKPNMKHQNFIAGPVKSAKDFKMFFYNIPDDLSVIISDVVYFVSEYRCFVKEGKLQGIKHYIGDFKLFPNIDYIEKCILAYKLAPKAYTLDVGITKTGETLIVECNDAWSIGNYGFDAGLYVDMLLIRWIQITKKCI